MLTSFAAGIPDLPPPSAPCRPGDPPPAAPAFLCADHGINTDFEGQHVAYIQSWIQLLKEDKKAIFRAASMAQKAADYLHGLQGEAVPVPATIPQPAPAGIQMTLL